MIARLLLFLFCGTALALDDFRPMIAEAIAKGEKKIVIPSGTYRLAPTGGEKCVWTPQGANDLEIVADGVTLVSTKLTRAVAITQCTGVTVRGLTIDYDPLPFTQGTVAAVADDKSWIDVKLHAGYPRQPYARIDFVDPATRYRKKGMPFLWGTKAEMQGDDTVRVTLKGIGNTATIGTLASLNTGPAPDGIPHALSIERCSAITLRSVTIHSAPGMGMLECDGDGKTTYLGCKVVPGPNPEGASEDRLLSTSWDAIQTKTVRHGPHVEDCEIREAGDDSWSVQSSDFMVLKRVGNTLTISSRDEYTIGVEKGDRLKTKIGGPEATITGLRRLSHEQAGLAPEVMEKLAAAESWSEWKVAPKCLEVTLNEELPVEAGTSVYSPDRMGNGFVFLNNRIHSSGRVLIKGAGRIEGNILDTPHAMVICPELPGNAAAGIDGLIIRKNTIRRSGWFCAAPWSTQTGALSITAGGGAQQLRPPGVFANIVIEDNTFEDCSGPNLVISSTQGVKIRGNRFIRPHHN
ncbi:MAG: right-handed parallel beta-helix repeat-containing protein, partial [Verrucomicrobiaceae bacterium]